MTIIDSIGNFFRSLGRNEYYKTRDLGNGITRLSSQPEFIQINNQNAYNTMMTTSELYAPIVRRGLMLASGVWVHERMKKDGSVEKIEGSDLVNILENPNPLMRGNDLVRQWDENMILYGNNYEYVLKPYSTAKPSILNNLPVNCVEMKTTGKWYKQSKLEEIIEGYKINHGTDFETIPTNEINHMRLVNSDNPLVGESPLKSLYMDISNIRSAKKFRNVVMTKEGALGFISNNTKDTIGAVSITPEDRKRMEDSYTEKYGLEDGKSKIFMSDANLKWNHTAFPVKDMLLFEEVDAGFKKIIDVLGLDENIFSSKSTYENKVQALRSTYQTTIIPLSEELSMNRTKVFGLDGKTEWLRLDYSAIPVLQENLVESSSITKSKAEAISVLVQSGMSFEEARVTVEL